MAKTKVVVDSGRTVFTGLKYMYITPWVAQTDGTGLELDENTYEIVNIVGDSTSLEQEDNDVQEVEHEFSSTPLYEAVTLGKKTFQALSFFNFAISTSIALTFKVLLFFMANSVASSTVKISFSDN